MRSCLLGRLHRDIRRKCQLRAGQPAKDLSARHTLPRLRILVRFGLVFVRSIPRGRHRLARLLAEREDQREGPAGHAGPPLN